jgi:hypothetical protein
MFQAYLDKSTPYTPYRWGGTALLFLFFGLRIFFAQGWYIGTLLHLYDGIAHLQTPLLPPQSPSQPHNGPANTS